MPANTPSGLPYPLPTEPVAEGAAAIRALAEKISGAFLIQDFLAASDGQQPDFAAIPQTYRDLLVIYSALGNSAGASASYGMVLNGITTNHYGHVITGDGAGKAVGQQFAYVGHGISSAIVRTAGRVLLPNYTGNSWKTWIGEDFRMDGATTPQLQLQHFGGGWYPPTPQAITRIQFTPWGYVGFLAGSRFSLYGVK